MLNGVDYSCIFEEPSALEAVYAIFANVLELDDEGNILNAKWAEHRAAQYVLWYVAGKQHDPPFEPWENLLYDPPPREDVLHWPKTKTLING